MSRTKKLIGSLSSDALQTKYSKTSAREHEPIVMEAFVYRPTLSLQTVCFDEGDNGEALRLEGGFV